MADKFIQLKNNRGDDYYDKLFPITKAELVDVGEGVSVKDKLEEIELKLALIENSNTSL